MFANDGASDCGTESTLVDIASVHSSVPDDPIKRKHGIIAFLRKTPHSNHDNSFIASANKAPRSSYKPSTGATSTPKIAQQAPIQDIPEHQLPNDDDDDDDDDDDGDDAAFDEVPFFPRESHRIEVE